VIIVDDLKVRFRLQGSDVAALDGVSLEIGAGEVFVLLGPSGCGKTTLLRCLAGLEVPQTGSIAIDGRPLSDASSGLFVAPNLRPLAMVFQSYAMWPHMNVFENIAFPLRAGSHGIPADEVGARVHEVLELLEIAALKDRPVTTLSGGQQQRVSLARALALRPKVLLMDEPLSNLDHQLQIQLRVQLRALMRRLGLTVVHVTHNQEEALELGDRIAVMNRGKVAQIADGPTLYAQPADSFVARFLGDMNLLPGSVISITGDRAVVETPLGKFTARAAAIPTGTSCYFGIRPHDVILGQNPADNSCPATVISQRYLGATVLHTLEAGAAHFQAVTRPDQAIAAGTTVRAHFPADRAIVVPAAQDVPYEDA